MKDIVIIGAGGFGREVAWLIEDINKVNNEWNIVGFVDDNKSIQGTEINGYKVVGDIDWLKEQELFVVNAIGDPIIKKKVMDRLDGSKNQYPVLIHPSVIYSESVNFGEGSIVCAGNIITVKFAACEEAVDVMSTQRRVRVALYVGNDVVDRSSIISVTPGNANKVDLSLNNASEAVVVIFDEDTKDQLDKAKVTKSQMRDLGGLF